VQKHGSNNLLQANSGRGAILGRFFVYNKSMSKGESHQQLVEHIHEQEHALQEAARKQRSVEHELKQQRELAARRLSQLKTIQTLSLGIFSRLDVEQIYQLTCQTVVHQLLWDSAFIVNLTEMGAEILASYQATQKQLDHLHGYLASSQAFLSAYTQRIAISTLDSKDTTSLSISSLFQTDEVIALPILFGDQLYGYIVACSHTHRGEKRTEDSIDFLAILASQIGHAVQNSTNFTSLEEQNNKLRELDELKDSFISITSHQLRTPLSIMKWTLAILQNDKEIMKLKEPAHMIDQAYVSNERLIHVVNDLLNVSRIREGKLPYLPQLTDLRLLLEELATSAETLMNDRKVSLKMDLPKTSKPVQLDTILFKEAIQNLLDNAIYYNRPEGSLKITLREEDGSAIITITNTGPGISKEDQPRIFNQFFRGTGAASQEPNGSGLGLYLSRVIIRQHGGEIIYRSTPGDETVFMVILPLAKAEKEKEE
jgi:signal transduction histidine kinase